MNRFIRRIGDFSARRPWTTIGAWAVLAALVIALSGALGGAFADDFSAPGSESAEAIELLEERFPEQAGGTAVAVFAAPDGQQVESFRPGVESALAQVATIEHVATVSDPFATGRVSADGRVAFAEITLDVPSTEFGRDTAATLVGALEPARAGGVQAEFGGDAAFLNAEEESSGAEVVGIVAALVVLLVAFGTVVAALLPILLALVAVGVGLSGVVLLAGGLTTSTAAPTIGAMVGLGVGIDYALFIVSRYRNELSRGLDKEQAVGRAVGTAGSAVVFAGLTVIVALAGLTVVGIPFLGEMGVAAALTVVIAVLIAVTLLPAVLGFAGDKIHGRLPGMRGGPKPGRASMGERWARFVGRHRVAVLGTAIAAVAVVAIPAASMQLGLPNDATAAPESTQHKAYELVSDGFGPGANGPLMVVVDTAGSTDPQGAVAATAKRITDLGTVVMPPQANRTGDTTIMQVIPKTGPSDVATEDLVADIRAAATQLQDSTGADIAVTGQTAANIDVSDKLSDAMLPYLLLIVGLAFLLLMLVFRSLVVPLKATIGFLASVAATFGAVVAVFQWGWLADALGVEATGPIMSMLPILMIGVLFGLAMDYQVFLVTRMREEYVHGAPAGEAMVSGFRHGARVVVAAALIMTSVFAGFVFAEDTLIQSIGFALAVGVAVDAFVVRMTIVPAVMALLGRSAWWLPRWLDRLLPNVDVEGERLVEPPRDEQPERTPVPV